MKTTQKEDRIFTASIIDAFYYRIRKDLRGCSQISFYSENARMCNIYVLQFMLPMICSSHCLTLNVYLHPDACCGKGCVEVHFVVSFRHLKRYITETRHDILTPEDVVDDLVYDNGFKNTSVDYIKTNRRHEACLRYEAAAEAGLIYSLGNPAEIRYCDMFGGKTRITA